MSLLVFDYFNLEILIFLGFAVSPLQNRGRRDLLYPGTQDQVLSNGAFVPGLPFLCLCPCAQKQVFS